MMLTLRHATPEDVPALTQTQTRAFDDDARRFGNMPQGGGPPGYNSEHNQHEMLTRATAYYTLACDETIIGGAMLFAQDDTTMYLGRIWIDPAYQGRGLGREAMHLLEQEFPQARRWTLETPVWATRNHAFYMACGYTNLGDHPHEPGQIAFEKRTG